MDLFVINRYQDSDDNSVEKDQEAKNLNRLKRKIEERKKTYQRDHQNTPQNFEITLKAPVEKPLEPEIIKTSDFISLFTEESGITNKDVIDTNDIAQEKTTNVEFKVLGSSEFEKKVKVKRVLPHWLSNPLSISTDLQNLFCDVETETWLHPVLKATLQNEGIAHLFPVQEKVVPFILQQHTLPAPLYPSDICVSAPTGSGKTLSFVLPIIQILMNETGRCVRALIVLPVQELAAQVAKVFRKYCTNTGLRVALLSGSTHLRQEQQQLMRYTESSSWVSEVDIIVCTAGRLVEHLRNTEGFSLKHLKFLVIDEADRIMDHIQNDWLYHLDRHIKLESKLMTGRMPSLCWANLTSQRISPHKLLFSATLSQDPEKLEQWGLFQPKLFSTASKSRFEDDDDEIRKYTTPDELTETSIVSDQEEKPLILYHLLVEQKWDRVLCFTNASQSAHRLAVLLNCLGNGTLKAAELSASLDRTTRDMVLKQFQQCEINILIGTDALARGIDIPDCNYVISYDPPRNIKTYIHRIGRTGRAGRKGCAVTMLLQNQLHLFKDILQSGGKNELPQLSIASDIFDKFSDLYNNAIQHTKNHIHNEINAKVKKSIGLKRGFQSKSKKLNKNKVRKGE